MRHNATGQENSSHMVRIRLRRIGAKHQPSYRIVVADKESPRDGRFLEIIGHYNPRTSPSTIVVDEARLYEWLGKGAQPSDSVAQILRSTGAWGRWERFKQGEALDALLGEAEQARPEIDQRTRRDDMTAGRASKKAEKTTETEAQEETA